MQFPTVMDTGAMATPSIIPNDGKMPPLFQPGVTYVGAEAPIIPGTPPVPGAGALQTPPGLLSTLMSQMPKMPKDEFNPKYALMGGALMDLGNIVMGRDPQGMPIQAYRMAKQMYDTDRKNKYASDQANFANMIAIGQLEATLQKSGLPKSTAGKLAYDLFGKSLSELTPDQITQLESVSKSMGSGTNITLNTNDTLLKERQKTAAKTLDTYDAMSIDTQPLMILDQMEIANDYIDTAGIVGNAADALNRGFESVGVDFRATSDTSWRELYNSLSTKLALNELQAFKGPTTDFEFAKAESVNGGLDNTQEGRDMMIQMAKGRLGMQQQFAAAYSEWGNNTLDEGGVPTIGKFRKSDVYKQLQQQTLFTQNPGLMVAFRNQMDDASWDRLVDRRTRQLEARLKQLYPDLDSTELDNRVEALLDQEMSGLGVN